MRDLSAESLRLYKARLYNVADYEDNRVQVRILPHMHEFKGDMLELLPWYPPFFKNMIFNGITEKNADSKKKEKPAILWVVALPDFTAGYILGYANNFESQTERPSNSFNFKEAKKALDDKKCLPPGLDYKNLHVQYFNDAYIEFIDTKLGCKVILNDRQTVFVLAHNVIKMRIGEDGESSYSEITMSNKEINLHSDKITLKANDISLGEKGLYLVASPSFIPITVEGVSLTGQMRVKC